MAEAAEVRGQVALPEAVERELLGLAQPGETLELAAPAGEQWVALTRQALYIGPPFRRVMRRWVTGIEFDRAGAGPGAMIFLGADGELARVTFAGMERVALAGVERRLSPPPGKRAIQVVLDQADFAPGERVSGRVLVDWPKARQVRGVRVGLVGVEESRVTVTRGSGKHRRRVTYRERTAIVENGRGLWGKPAIGWWSSMGEGIKRLWRKLDYDELPAGRHQYPFEFRIPGGAPPTYSGRHATVAYRLFAHVDVPLGFDLVHEGPLLVVARRGARMSAARHLHRQEAEGVLKAFRASLSLDLEVHDTEMRPGARIEGRVVVDNRSGKRIRAAVLELVGQETARARGHVETAAVVLQSGRLEARDPAAARQEIAFGIEIPRGAVAYSGERSEVYLFLRARLDIAMGFDAVVEVPLTVV